MNDILDDTNDIIQFYHNIIENKINLYMVGLVKGYEKKLLHKFKKLYIYSYNNSNYIKDVLQTTLYE